MNEHNNSHDGKQKRSALGSPVVWCVGIFIVYALSPYPLLVIGNNLPAPAKDYFMQAWIYYCAPLDYFYQNFPAIEQFYNWYGRLFGL